MLLVSRSGIVIENASEVFCHYGVIDKIYIKFIKLKIINIISITVLTKLIICQTRTINNIRLINLKKISAETIINVCEHTVKMAPHESFE